MPVQWSVVTGDPDPNVSAADILREVKAKTSGGAIIIMHGNGDSLFYNRNAWGFQTLTIPTRHNIWNGWDMSTPISFGMLVKGNPSMPGAFGVSRRRQRSIVTAWLSEAPARSMVRMNC